jgi:YHS domain-containing protein
MLAGKRASFCVAQVAWPDATPRPGLPSNVRRRKLMAIDPVCKMEINEEDAAAHTEYNGQDFYFCSRGCEEKFTHNPGEFVEGAAA